MTASPIAIRLADKDRATLEAAAAAAGQGLSTYVRQLAEGEARRIRVERTRRQLTEVAAAIDAFDVESEVELMSSDGEDWPAWTGPLPG